MEKLVRILIVLFLLFLFTSCLEIIDTEVDEIFEQESVYSDCTISEEGQTAVLNCKNGEITKIEFASYGTPEGSCENDFTKSSCHSENSVSKVEEPCLGKSSCEVPANNDVFGDPCPNVKKHLYIKYLCEGEVEDETVTIDEDETTVNDDDEIAIDECLDDPNKTKPGQCGCNRPDTDTDKDNVADCIDSCPFDPNKYLPGTCGGDVNQKNLEYKPTLDL